LWGNPVSEVHPGKNPFRKFTLSKDNFYAIAKGQMKPKSRLADFSPKKRMDELKNKHISLKKYTD
jgi:hypothetical protein